MPKEDSETLDTVKVIQEAVFLLATTEIGPKLLRAVMIAPAIEAAYVVKLGKLGEILEKWVRGRKSTEDTMDALVKYSKTLGGKNV